MIVLGFDPGWGKTGWALLEGETELTACGIIKPRAGAKAIRALPKTAQIEHTLTCLPAALQALKMDLPEADLVVVEHRQPFPGRASGGWKTSLAQGAIFTYWASRGFEVKLVHPSQVRATALGKTGRRKSEKGEAVAAALERWGAAAFESIPPGQREHVADAAHAALTGWRKHGGLAGAA